MQVEGPVRLVAVQENRHRCDGDMGEYEGYAHQFPPGKIEQSGEEHQVLDF
jgi:hypothetical protein